MDTKRKPHFPVDDPILTSQSVFAPKSLASNPTRRRAAHTTRQPKGSLLVASELPQFRYAPDPWLPKTQAKLLSSLAAAIAQPTRWSKLAVASNIVGQLGLLIVTGKWPPQSSTGNTMRGIDFYPWKDFLRALIYGAHLFKAENGYVPPLAFPTSFNEHLFARKFFAPLPMPSLADKLAAKDRVKARLGDDFIPAVVWVGDDVGGLFAAKPPAGRYVLKSNHGWNSNLFLNLPEDLSAKRDEIKQRAKSWLTTRFGYDWGEWQYCTFKPKLFLEEFIDFNDARAPDDYKFFCFHGKACLIEIDVDRFTRPRTAFYTPDWEHIPAAYRHAPIVRARPRNLENMIRVAEAIAGDMEFARVDLYTDGSSRIKFGEITFTPGNAAHFSDFEFDQWFGGYFGKGGGSITFGRRLRSPIPATETRLPGMRAQS
jgi:hypothetical protein